MVQLAGDEPEWKSADLDLVASRLIVLDMQNKVIPCRYHNYLVINSLAFLPKFTTFYRQGLHQALKIMILRQGGWQASMRD